MISLLQMTPKSNVEGLGSVLKHKKVVMHLTEDIAITGYVDMHTCTGT